MPFQQHHRQSQVALMSAVEVSSFASPGIEMIDNTQRCYDSIMLNCGVIVQLGENVLRDSPDIIDIINHDLLSCMRVLPKSVESLVKRTQIWINRSFEYGNIYEPTVLSHTTAHHFPGWLDRSNDKSEKVASVEIYNSVEYLNLRLDYNGCGLLLHELCHLIHQAALPGGLNNMLVVETYKFAIESGKYENVFRRDWALKEKETDLAYCTINHKEFFAEISVSYLSDFYHDVDGSEMIVGITECSPPFVSSIIFGRMERHHKDASESNAHMNVESLVEWKDLTKFGRGLPHCNKFFPFTCGQLRRYDPRIYKCFEKLWQYIEAWEDTDRN